MTTRSAGAERLHQARRSAARELGLKITDPSVIRLAALQAAFDQIQVQIANGKDVDVVAMMKLDVALAEVRAASKPMEVVRVEIVDNIAGTCPQCGYQGCEPRPITPSPPPVIDGEAVKPEPVTPVAVAKPTLEDVQQGRLLPDGSPHPNTLPRRPGGSVHDAWLGDTPARMSGASYGFADRGSYQGVAGPFSVRNEPKPNFEQHHNLPSAPGANWDVVPR